VSHELNLIGRTSHIIQLKKIEILTTRLSDKKKSTFLLLKKIRFLGWKYMLPAGIKFTTKCKNRAQKIEL
jgi:hypothetical protein